MKNKLIDLNDHLFAQLERLGDEGLSGQKLGEEIERSKSICHVSKSIVNNARLALDAELARGNLIESRGLPAMLEHKK